MPSTAAINGARAPFTPSCRTNHSLPLSKLPLLQRMASNDNDQCKMEEEAESSMTRKHLQHIDDHGGDDDSFDSSDSPDEEPPEEEPEEEEEVSLEEISVNQLDTSEEKLYARRAHGILFKDNNDTPSTSSESPPTWESHRRSDEESRDDDNDDDDLCM
jgi:hypothetical protein